MPARYARRLLQAVASHGLDSTALLAAANLTAEEIAPLDGWIEANRMQSLLEVAVRETGDDDLGLHIGARVDLASLSIVGYAMHSAATLGDALYDLARYRTILYTRSKIHIERGADKETAAVEIVPTVPDVPLAAPRHSFELLVAAVLSAASALTGRPLPVVSVAFAHPRPETGVAAHESLFGVEPTFDAPSYRLTFDAAALGWPVRSASPSLHAAFTREADQVVARASSQIHPRVEASVRARLDGTLPTLTDAASDLGMSERTLQRHLEHEGTTFQAICDEVRRTTALHLLTRGDATLHEIAFTLGYSAPSAFHRAFKRWTGRTPMSFQADRVEVGSSS